MILFGLPFIVAWCFFYWMDHRAIEEAPAALIYAATLCDHGQGSIRIVIEKVPEEPWDFGLMMLAQSNFISIQFEQNWSLHQIYACNNEGEEWKNA